jgi:glycerol-3-phosphate dehydrogenase
LSGGCQQFFAQLAQFGGSVDAEVTVVGAGVVGSAVALALARRGGAVVVLEAEPEPGLGASGTNSGIVHTGFDSPPGELETELILRSARLRDPVLEALGLPVLRCGALLRPLEDSQRETVAALADNARANGVVTVLRQDGALEVPGEAVTDPVAFTLALSAAAERHGAEVRTGFRVAAIERVKGGLELVGEDGRGVMTRVAVNCAGLGADRVARLAGDDSFEIYPRKGEFLVFDPPGGEPLERVLLPVPTKRTKGVLVFPTLDGKIVAGPTAVDGEDKDDWSVRPEARTEILPKAVSMYPPLESEEPVAAYAGLRPAGKGVNYLIGPSPACDGLVNVAAIRSTGLTASLAIAERVCSIVERLGARLGEEQPLRPGSVPRSPAPWWRRTAEARAA